MVDYDRTNKIAASDEEQLHTLLKKWSRLKFDPKTGHGSATLNGVDVEFEPSNDGVRATIKIQKGSTKGSAAQVADDLNQLARAMVDFA